MTTSPESLLSSPKAMLGTENESWILRKQISKRLRLERKEYWKPKPCHAGMWCHRGMGWGRECKGASGTSWALSADGSKDPKQECACYTVGVLQSEAWEGHGGPCRGPARLFSKQEMSTSGRWRCYHEIGSPLPSTSSREPTGNVYWGFMTWWTSQDFDNSNFSWLGEGWPVNSYHRSNNENSPKRQTTL